MYQPYLLTVPSQKNVCCWQFDIENFAFVSFAIVDYTVMISIGHWETHTHEPNPWLLVTFTTSLWSHPSRCTSLLMSKFRWPLSLQLFFSLFYVWVFVCRWLVLKRWLLWPKLSLSLCSSPLLMICLAHSLQWCWKVRCNRGRHVVLLTLSACATRVTILCVCVCFAYICC